MNGIEDVSTLMEHTIKAFEIVMTGNEIVWFTFVMNKQCLVVGHEELSIGDHDKVASRRDQGQRDFVCSINTTYGVYMFIFLRKCMK